MTSQLANALTFTARTRESEIATKPGRAGLSHIFAVAALVLEDGGSEAEAVAALLHHMLDHPRHPNTSAEIEQQFGPRVAALVGECANSLDGEPFAPAHRRRAYLERIRQTRHATRILLAHEVHHARELLRSPATDGEFHTWLRAGAPGLPGYHRELVSTFREAGGSSALLEELDRLLRALERRASSAHTVRVFCYPVLLNGAIARCMFDGSQVWSEQWAGAAWEGSSIPVAEILSADHVPWPTLAQFGVPEADW